MKSIAVVSNRRNSGKTTTAINLAIGISQNGKDVILVDADEHAKINYYLGAKDRNLLDHVLRGEKDVMEALYLHPSGIRIVPSIINKYREHKIHIRTPIEDLKTKTDIIVINAPVEELNLNKVLDATDEVLFVCPAEPYSIKDINETIRKVHAKGKTVVGLVLTRKGKLDYSNEAHKLTGIPILSSISEDNYVDLAIKQNAPLILLKNKSKAAKDYEKLAKFFT